MVVRMHGLTGWVGKPWKDRIPPRRRQVNSYEVAELLNADCVTLPSEHLRDAVEQRLPRERVITLPNGIDVRRWMQDATADCTQDITDRDILCAGTLKPGKGVFELIDAVTRLRRRGEWSGRLILIGRSTPDFDRYRMKNWGPRGEPPAYVELRGQLPRASLAAAYRNAGVCCFPSWSEPFGYTALEAAASGGLVIGASGGGMVQMIADGETGFLVPPRNSIALCGVLEKALRLSASEKTRIRSVAQQRALQAFDQDQISMRIVAIYQDQIDRFRSARKTIYELGSSRQ
jgi:glycosyltransferase involved in cell wall biosynthesis